MYDICMTVLCTLGCVHCVYCVLLAGSANLQGIEEADACKAANVRAYPTWVVNGTTVEGELTFDEFDKLLKGEPIPFVR